MIARVRRQELLSVGVGDDVLDEQVRLIGRRGCVAAQAAEDIAPSPEVIENLFKAMDVVCRICVAPDREILGGFRNEVGEPPLDRVIVAQMPEQGDRGRFAVDKLVDDIGGWCDRRSTKNCVGEVVFVTPAARCDDHATGQVFEEWMVDGLEPSPVVEATKDMGLPVHAERSGVGLHGCFIARAGKHAATTAVTFKHGAEPSGVGDLSGRERVCAHEEEVGSVQPASEAAVMPSSKLPSTSMEWPLNMSSSL